MPESTSSGGCMVLVVGDDPEVGALLVCILRRHGYEVEAPVGGSDALEHLRGRRCGLVVLDLPELESTPWRFLQAMSSRAPEERVAVLALVTDVATGQAAIAAGARAWLPKPFRTDTFVAVVDGLAPTGRL